MSISQRTMARTASNTCSATIGLGLMYFNQNYRRTIERKLSEYISIVAAKEKKRATIFGPRTGVG